MQNKYLFTEDKLFDTRGMGSVFSLSPALSWILAVLSATVLLLLSATAVSIAGAEDRADISSLGYTRVIQGQMESRLLKDAFPKVNSLVKNYYTSLSSGSLGQYVACVDTYREEELASVQNLASLYEGYQDIHCYTKPGMEEGAYFVFATYSLKFAHVDTTAPGFEVLYAYPDGEGKLVLYNQEVTDEILEAANKAAQDPDVQAVRGQVETEYEAAKQADSALMDLDKRLKGGA